MNKAFRGWQLEKWSHSMESLNKRLRNLSELCLLLKRIVKSDKDIKVTHKITIPLYLEAKLYAFVR